MHDMVATRDELIERACLGKNAYSFATARLVAERARKRRHGRISPYRCPFCAYYHLGHPLSYEGLREFAAALRGIEPYDEQHNIKADMIGRNGHR